MKSYGSSYSSISANWKGKSTRYVPHCEKRHLHDENGAGGEYLTPTQRKNRLIADLRRQLRAEQKLVEEKSRHIDQLRDRLTELEAVLDQGGYLSENYRLQCKIKQNEEKFKREKQAICLKYEKIVKRLRKAIPPETNLVGADWGESMNSSFEGKKKAKIFRKIF